MVEAQVNKIVRDHEAALKRNEVIKHVFMSLVCGAASLALVLACYPQNLDQPKNDQTYIPKPDGPVRPLDPVLMEIQERNNRIFTESQSIAKPDGVASPR